MEVGRPTVMTGDVIGKLEHAFSLGCTDLEACFYAGISKDALYDYQKKEPKFSERKELLKKSPIFKARRKILDHMDSEDEQISIKATIDTMNRYLGKPKESLEMTGPGGGPIQTITNEMSPKEAAQAFRDQIKDS